MNAKQLFAIAALALAAGSSFAVEAEQFIAPQGALTRAEVKAELARAQAAGEVAIVSATYGSFEPTARHAAAKPVDQSSARSRDEVRSEVRATGRSQAFDSLYVGG